MICMICMIYPHYSIKICQAGYIYSRSVWSSSCFRAGAVWSARSRAYYADDLYDLYDPYDLAHVAGWELCDLHGLGTTWSRSRSIRGVIQCIRVSTRTATAKTGMQILLHPLTTAGEELRTWSRSWSIWSVLSWAFVSYHIEQIIDPQFITDR